MSIYIYIYMQQITFYLFHENNGIEFVSSVKQLLLMEAQQLAHTYQSMKQPHPTTKEAKTLNAYVAAFRKEASKNSFKENRAISQT